MAKKPHEQSIPGQNFLRSPKLVRALVGASTIGHFDTVYEIGPGGGMITAELARIAYKVIAIEKDPVFVQRLHERFRDSPNVEIIEKDFLQYHISDREYKIFANIPYNITAQIVRKILHTAPWPGEAYLVMQKEAAEKFAGSPKETQFSILARPFCELQIMRELRRTDFEPVPQVDSVLLHIKPRAMPLVYKKDILLYGAFVRYGFGRWKKSLKLAFKPVFTYPQWKRLSKELHFPLEATPSELSFEQWLGLFECFKQRVPGSKQVHIKR